MTDIGTSYSLCFILIRDSHYHTGSGKILVAWSYLKKMLILLLCHDSVPVKRGEVILHSSFKYFLYFLKNRVFYRTRSTSSMLLISIVYLLEKRFLNLDTFRKSIASIITSP